ncbi:hypothetical protein EYF80_042859 [Liparis tanakae]|uniref:Uncharacterized protein n=1 Tax=Liparis tanakae TaxID=230148 RepID=A0A4Z2G219_9TELE|nr:hypothetical protein EYF80_042859 [Liparis tanakae]
MSRCGGLLEARARPLADDPDGAEQGAAGVQPEGPHQVMLPGPGPMEPCSARGRKRPFPWLSVCFILIYQAHLSWGVELPAWETLNK